jgi:hypothetical protein
VRDASGASPKKQDFVYCVPLQSMYAQSMKFRGPLSLLFIFSLVWSGLLCASQRGVSSIDATSAHASCHDCDGPGADQDHDGAPAKNADHGCPAGFGSCCSTWDVARLDVFSPGIEQQSLPISSSGHIIDCCTLAVKVDVSLHASRAAPNHSRVPSLTDPRLDASLQGRAPPHSA